MPLDFDKPVDEPAFTTGVGTQWLERSRKDRVRMGLREVREGTFRNHTNQWKINEYKDEIARSERSDILKVADVLKDLSQGKTANTSFTLSPEDTPLIEDMSRPVDPRMFKGNELEGIVLPSENIGDVAYVKPDEWPEGKFRIYWKDEG